MPLKVNTNSSAQLYTEMAANLRRAHGAMREVMDAPEAAAPLPPDAATALPPPPTPVAAASTTAPKAALKPAQAVAPAPKAALKPAQAVAPKAAPVQPAKAAPPPATPADKENAPTPAAASSLRRRAPAATARHLSDASAVDEEAQKAAELARLDELRAERSKSVTPPHVAVVPDGISPGLPEHPDEVAALMRIPEVHKARTVVISQKCQGATTSSSHASKAWRLGWKTEERWTNPLMGWTSTGDPLSNAEIKFETAAQAEAFATKMGWTFETERPIVRDKRYGTNTYSHNFLQKWVETDLKEYGIETEWFHKVEPNASHYFRPLKFHGDGECIQHGHRVPGSATDADHDWKREGSPGTAWTKKAATAPEKKWNPFAAAAKKAK